MATKTKYPDLQAQVKSYCARLGIEPKQIQQGKVENPFPIGKSAVYQDLYLNGVLSYGAYCKLFEFFTNLNNDKQNGTNGIKR